MSIRIKVVNKYNDNIYLQTDLRYTENTPKRRVVPTGSLVNREGAKKLREQVLQEREGVRGQELVGAIIDHFNGIHRNDLPLDFEIEKMILQDGLNALTISLDLEKDMVTFRPSSAGKCERELYYRAINTVRDEVTMFPYQRRWTRNASAVHSAVQRDLLYGEKYLSNPLFTVQRTETGRPAWEYNLRQVKKFEESGVKFQLYGMMDGVLVYTPDGSQIGFEFKTKSTTIGAIGSYKMKDIQESHKEQCIAYSLLFGLDEFIILYESLAKDNWTKREDARPDLRAFYYKVTEKDREKMLNKFIRVAEYFYAGELPTHDMNKCIFCPYKGRCSDDIQERAM